MGLNGLHPRNTTGAWFTLRDRPDLSVRDRGKLGPSGESNAQPNGIAASGCAGVFCVCEACEAGNRLLKSRSPCKGRSSQGSRPGRIHTAPGRGKMPRHHPCRVYGKGRTNESPDTVDNF